MASGGTTPTIPTYYVGLHFVLCHGPIDKVYEIRSDKKTAWRWDNIIIDNGDGTTSTAVSDIVNGDGTGGQIGIVNEFLYGGPTREGGIIGFMDIDMGLLNQPVNTYLSSVVNSILPAFRGVVSAIFKHGYVGNNYYLKPWSFKISRLHTLYNDAAQWHDELAAISVTLPIVAQVTTLGHTSYASNVVTDVPHKLKAFDTINVSGATGPWASYYNGTFVIIEYGLTDYTFSYYMTGVPLADATGDIVITKVEGDEVSGPLMNGIHILRECLTDPIWGYGYDSNSDFYEQDWVDAATTCFNEGLGFGFLWSGEETLEDFMNDVLRHIQGNIYRGRTDGLWHISLVRKILDASTLSILDESRIGKVSHFARKSLGDLVSTVTVRFPSNATWEDDAVTVSDSSLQQRQGTPVSRTITYAGITCAEVAQKIALRDLAQLSLPLYTATLTCTKYAENFHIGQAFILRWPDYVPTDLIMRVVSINLGTPQKGEISIEAIQDNFHAADVIYYTPTGSGWTDPINVPQQITLQTLIEAPYYLVAKSQGDTFAQAVDLTNTFIVIGAVSPTPDAMDAGIWTKTSGTYARSGYMDFCFTATLAAGISRTATTVTLSNIVNLNLLTVGAFIKLNNEFMQVTLKTSNSLTVIRGVLDTVPVTHSIDARMFGLENFYGTDNITYFTGETVYNKLTTVTGRGELALASALEQNITLIGRMHMPYPPANVKINSTYWPASVSHTDPVVTWVTRNRLLETSALYGFYTGTITTEANVTYSGTLKRTDNAALLFSFTEEAVVTKTLSGLSYVGEVILDLWAVRDGLDSFQHVTHTFTLT